MKTLVIKSSILGDNSKSKILADHLVAKIKHANPTGVITVRDLGANPLPLLDGNVVGAFFTPADARTPAQKEIVAVSESLIAELMDTDRVVITAPVYNFGLPAQLKTYIDYIARSGVTFRYSPEGVPEGLIKGKEVIVLVARGGKAEGTPNDTLTPYLRQVLSFVGMSDLTFIAAEGMGMGPEAVTAGLEEAKVRIDALTIKA